MGKPVKRAYIYLWFSLGLVLFFVAAPREAQAARDNTACTIRIIHATNTGKTFDAKLEPLKAQLTRPPLSAWTSFTLLKQVDLSLHALAPTTFPLPDDHKGSLEFLGTVESNGSQRLRLRWQILDGAAKLLSTTFVIDDGGTVLQAGLKHKDGLLVLGLTCKLSS